MTQGLHEKKTSGSSLSEQSYVPKKQGESLVVSCRAQYAHLEVTLFCDLESCPRGMMCGRWEEQWQNGLWNLIKARGTIACCILLAAVAPTLQHAVSKFGWGFMLLKLPSCPSDEEALCILALQIYLFKY